VSVLWAMICRFLSYGPYILSLDHALESISSPSPPPPPPRSTHPSAARSSPPAAMAAAAQRLLAASTKIVGVGRNFVAHAKELGNPVPKEPVLFLKPTSSFLHAGVAGAAIEVPEPVESLHHEVELAVVISQRARDVPEASAMDFVGGYALALDMTARELQSAAKSAGLPWTLGKAQDTFTPISAVVSNVFSCLKKLVQVVTRHVIFHFHVFACNK
jgi:2-keto-4-pentenoate hydratase/2-oxohepta-3-ene-1,7-dioic acid hydratase in catechol pathway